MREKINQKGFIQIPLLIAIIVSIAVISVGGYGGFEYYKTSKIIKEAKQLAEEEKYNEAIEKLETVQNSLVVKNLGLKRQEINSEIEVNKRNFEDKSKFIQSLGKISEGNYQEAIDSFSELPENSFYYKDAQLKIEEAKRKIVEEELGETKIAQKKAEEKAQQEAIKRSQAEAKAQQEEFEKKLKEQQLSEKEAEEKAQQEAIKRSQAEAERLKKEVEEAKVATTEEIKKETLPQSQTQSKPEFEIIKSKVEQNELFPLITGYQDSKGSCRCSSGYNKIDCSSCPYFAENKLKVGETIRMEVSAIPSKNSSIIEYKFEANVEGKPIKDWSNENFAEYTVPDIAYSSVAFTVVIRNDYPRRRQINEYDDYIQILYEVQP